MTAPSTETVDAIKQRLRETNPELAELLPVADKKKFARWVRLYKYPYGAPVVRNGTLLPVPGSHASDKDFANALCVVLYNALEVSDTSRHQASPLPINILLPGDVFLDFEWLSERANLGRWQGEWEVTAGARSVHIIANSPVLESCRTAVVDDGDEQNVDGFSVARSLVADTCDRAETWYAQVLAVSRRWLDEDAQADALLHFCLAAWEKAYQRMRVQELVTQVLQALTQLRRRQTWNALSGGKHDKKRRTVRSDDFAHSVALTRTIAGANGWGTFFWPYHSDCSSTVAHLLGPFGSVVESLATHVHRADRAPVVMLPGTQRLKPGAHSWYPEYALCFGAGDDSEIDLKAIKTILEQDAFWTILQGLNSDVDRVEASYFTGSTSGQESIQHVCNSHVGLETRRLLTPIQGFFPALHVKLP